MLSMPWKAFANWMEVNRGEHIEQDPKLRQRLRTPEVDPMVSPSGCFWWLMRSIFKLQYCFPGLNSGVEHLMMESLRLQVPLSLSFIPQFQVGGEDEGKKGGLIGSLAQYGLK